jgi:hypothetical protein
MGLPCYGMQYHPVLRSPVAIPVAKNPRRGYGGFRVFIFFEHLEILALINPLSDQCYQVANLPLDPIGGDCGAIG